MRWKRPLGSAIPPGAGRAGAVARCSARVRAHSWRPPALLCGSRAPRGSRRTQSLSRRARRSHPPHGGTPAHVVTRFTTSPRPVGSATTNRGSRTRRASAKGLLPEPPDPCRCLPLMAHLQTTRSRVAPGRGRRPDDRRLPLNTNSKETARARPAAPSFRWHTAPIVARCQPGPYCPSIVVLRLIYGLLSGSRAHPRLSRSTSVPLNAS